MQVDLITEWEICTGKISGSHVFAVGSSVRAANLIRADIFPVQA